MSRIVLPFFFSSLHHKAYYKQLVISNSLEAKLVGKVTEPPINSLREQKAFLILSKCPFFPDFGFYTDLI